MILTVKLFGPAARIIGSPELHIPESGAALTCGTLRLAIARHYPQLAELIPSGRIAVNHSYASDEIVLTGGEEIALIHAVSGG
ncbi:MAG TPA: MoaD/ThiS family protein [Phycisphaerae bacterium]|nr:MoaD/ThiS family protein [Phycisphaerae bacterium]